MNPLVYIAAGVVALLILVFVYMSGSGAEEVSSDEERDVNQETRSEMKKNLDEYAKETKEEQPPEDEVGYYSDK